MSILDEVKRKSFFDKPDYLTKLISLLELKGIDKINYQLEENDAILLQCETSQGGLYLFLVKPEWTDTDTASIIEYISSKGKALRGTNYSDQYVGLSIFTSGISDKDATSILENNGVHRAGLGKVMATAFITRKIGFGPKLGGLVPCITDHKNMKIYSLPDQRPAMPIWIEKTLRDISSYMLGKIEADNVKEFPVYKNWYANCRLIFNKADKMIRDHKLGI